MNIIEAMVVRRSVRTFDGSGLRQNELDMLRQAIKESFSPFGGHLAIRLGSFDLTARFKPSTYGMIRGASDFFLVGYGDDENSQLTAGFQFEQIVLRATTMGLGTCWIAATFKGSDFERGGIWPKDEELKIVCPVGTAAKPSFIEKVSRIAVGSKNRKPFNDLFFASDFHSSITDDNTFRQALEMMRIAPSSTNSQPWRALVDGNTVHFYYVQKSRLAVLDCGIGICHFFETERFNGCSGRFEKMAHYPVPPGAKHYLISYVRE